MSALTRQQLEEQTRVLLGDVSSGGQRYTSTQVQKALQWAQEQLVRVLGLTYTETVLAVDVSARVAVPLDALSLPHCRISDVPAYRGSMTLMMLLTRFSGTTEVPNPDGTYEGLPDPFDEPYFTWQDLYQANQGGEAAIPVIQEISAAVLISEVPPFPDNSVTFSFWPEHVDGHTLPITVEVQCVPGDSDFHMTIDGVPWSSEPVTFDENEVEVTIYITGSSIPTMMMPLHFILSDGVTTIHRYFNARKMLLS